VRSGASDNGFMESRAPRLGFSLDALIAEAKRRARQRRLVVTVLLIAVAAVVAALVFGPLGANSRSNGLPGLGKASSGSESVRVGALAFTVPRGFYPDKIQCPIRHCQPAHSPIRVRVSSHPFTAATSQFFPAYQVVLDVQYLGSGELARARPPLNLHEFRRMPGLGDGHGWSQIVSVGGSTYTVMVFEGSKAPAADRAALLRAFRSIRRAR